MENNYTLSIYTIYKIGGLAKHFCICNSLDEIRRGISFAVKKKFSWFILGNGSNILISDDGFPGLVIKLSGDFKKIFVDDDIVEAGAGVLLPTLSSHLMGKGWGGFEFMCGIPGTIGGGVRMNAGTKQGEVKDHFTSATLLSSNGQVRTIFKGEMHFSHRTSHLAKTGDIVLSAKFKLPYPEKRERIKSKIMRIMAERRKKQPKIRRNCGSVVKRPAGEKSAGWYIDQTGLKGLRVGDAMVAHEHANWIVNLGTAKAEHVKSLIAMIQNEVFKKFGVFLEREVIFVPEDILGDRA